MLQFRQRIVQLDQELPDEDDSQLEFEFPARRRAPASYASDD
jgi:hypothetical protein